MLPGVYREPRSTSRAGDDSGARRSDVRRGGIARDPDRPADRVTIRGLTLRNVGHSYTEDRAAIRLDGVRGCAITGNRFDGAFFGIYAARSSDCVVADNVFEGRGGKQTTVGNAIHLFQSDGFVVARNRIRGHRDGIYLEFSPRARILENESAANLRYGLHFMYSDSCDYRGNRSLERRRRGGHVQPGGDHDGQPLRGQPGAAAYGLLLKDIKDSRVEGNLFARNTVGLYAEGSDRIVVAGNQFLGNGWAVRLMADAIDNSFRRNRFEGNSFDVATNSAASARAASPRTSGTGTPATISIATATGTSPSGRCGSSRCWWSRASRRSFCCGASSSTCWTWRSG